MATYTRDKPIKVYNEIILAVLLQHSRTTIYLPAQAFMLKHMVSLTSLLTCFQCLTCWSPHWLYTTTTWGGGGGGGNSDM